MDKENQLRPRDHAEAVAHFRIKIIGELTARELNHGELALGLRELSTRKFRPPGSQVTRSYGVSTLERWYHRYRRFGLAGVTPKPRSDRGFAQQLTEAERELILAVRRDNRHLSAKAIIRALSRKGLVREGVISENSLRRLYRSHGLERRSKRHAGPGKSRRSWEAEHPGDIWHADVCHGPTLVDGTRRYPLRVHGILDDSSRYGVIFEGRHTELEFDMLQLLTNAIRRWGRPKVLYVDNGATYRGTTLLTFCNRLNIRLLHAEPYDAQARGKIERFWRTLREGCLDHLTEMATLHDVNVRLYAFLDGIYHVEPHSSLVGETPGEAWAQRKPLPEVTEQELHQALLCEVTRRVSNTGIVSVAGIDWELEQGFLAGKKVHVFRSLLDPTAPPWVEYDGQQLTLHRVNAKENAHRRRPPASGHRMDTIPFDPLQPFVEQLAGRDPKKGEKR